MIAACHNGVFHADDVFTAAAIRLLFKDVEFIRTRRPSDICQADIVFDVGGVYDGDRRFDHHQFGREEWKKGEGCRHNGVPYAAFGLFWAHYGHSVISSFELMRIASTDAIRDALDQQLIQGIDATDNGWVPDLGGQGTQDGQAWSIDGWTVPGQGHPLPAARLGEAMTISETISGFNPTWAEPSAPADFDTSFERAVQFAGVVLERAVRQIDAELSAADIIMEAETTRDGKVLFLEHYVPWQKHIFARPDANGLLYVVFPDPTGEWRVQQVPEEPGSFKGRKPLPAEWPEASDQGPAALQELTGVGDATFCHGNRFIAGAKSREGIMRMARLAVIA